MANPKIQVDITGDAKGFKKAADDAGDAIDKVGKKADDVDKKGQGGFLSGLGDQAGDLARDKLGPLGDALDAVGIEAGGLSAPVAAAGAAMAGLGAFAAQGVGKFVDLAGSVRKFADTTGISYESSSKLIAISDDLGIEADKVATSMGRLAKNIDAGKLEEFGIEVVRAKDGTVDLEATLGKVADAMNATTDPTKKAAMGTALFGKSWADLQPVLQQGSKGIAAAMAEVSNGQIVTEESADAAREWEMALDDAQDAISELQMAMGKEMLPALTQMLSDFSAAVGATDKLSNSFGGLGDMLQGAFNPYMMLTNARLDDSKRKADEAASSMTTLGVGMATAAAEAAVQAAKVKDVSQAEQDAATKADLLEAHQRDLAAAHKEAAEAAAEQKTRLDELNGVVLTIADTQLNYNSALAATNQATDSLTQRHIELDHAVATYGEGSAEAWEATKNYQDGLRGAESAAIAQAKATADLAEKTAIAAGQTFTAEQKNIVYRDSLASVAAATTDPNLQGGLNSLIGLTDAAAATAGNAAAQYYAMEAAASRAAAVAAGIANAGGGGVGSADSAERRLTNQSLPGNATVQTTVNIDGKAAAEALAPGTLQYQRSRR